MLIEVQKKEMVEVQLLKTKYVCFCNSAYYRFTPMDDTILVLRFHSGVTGTILFYMTNRKGIFDNEISILDCSAEYTNEITEEEFNSELQKLLLENI